MFSRVSILSMGPDTQFVFIAGFGDGRVTEQGKTLPGDPALRLSWTRMPPHKMLADGRQAVWRYVTACWKPAQHVFMRAANLPRVPCAADSRRASHSDAR